MRRKLPKILVTGGAGFIGSEFVRLISVIARREAPKQSRNSLVVVDNLTYAGDLKRLEAVKGKFRFYKCNICDKRRLESIFKKEKPQLVVSFAAETHVDRSILSAAPFIETNIIGTQVILDIIKNYDLEKLIHISTDEVYGETKDDSFSEDSPLKPNSPYAASKAAADLLIKSYIRTYGLPAIIIRPSNNYGPWQYPEKLIPVVISRALKNKSVPVYAKGHNIREWLYVSDCANAISMIMQKGKTGEVYNVGSGQERKNIDVVKLILKILGKPQNLIEFVKDRPGHDIRYSLDCKKVSHEINWKPKVKFEEGIKRTIFWYLKNKTWLLSKH